MAEVNNQVNTGSEDRSGKKPVIIAASVTCAVLIAAVAVFFLRNSIWFGIAENLADKGRFYDAHSVICRADDIRSAEFRKYISLRVEINKNYPKLVSEFDRETIEKWYDTAAELDDSKLMFGEKTEEAIDALKEKLKNILDLCDGYEKEKSDISEMMEVFNEINRLYSKTEGGKNPAFTVADELKKTEKWEKMNEDISSFASTIPGYEKVFLLNYLLKEAMGECEDIREAMDTVLKSGYSETDRVRLSGDAQNTFPDITSSSDQTVNLLNKKEYIAMLDKGVYRAIAQMMAEFYTVGISE